MKRTVCATTLSSTLTLCVYVVVVGLVWILSPMWHSVLNDRSIGMRDEALEHKALSWQVRSGFGPLLGVISHLSLPSFTARSVQWLYSLIKAQTNPTNSLLRENKSLSENVTFISTVRSIRTSQGHFERAQTSP